MVQDLLQVDDKYELRLDSILSSYDRKLISRLYQPILGFGAASLFFTLWSELEGDQTYSITENSHQRLLSLLQCDVRQFLEFRSKLEAVGLLRTLKKEDRGEHRYLYVLKAPLAPKDFFAHPLLNLLLYKYVDASEYQKTKLYFSKTKKNEEDYVDISASSSDVYSFDKDAQIIDDGIAVIGRKTGEVQLHFDFETFYLRLKEYLIPKKLLTKEIEREIASLATVYQISAYDMVNIVSESVINKNNQERTIDVSKMQSNAEKFARIHSNQSTPEPVTATPETVSTQGSLQEKVALFERLTPLEFLTVRSNGIPPLSSDVRMIEQLKAKSKLPDSVINVILDYTLLTQNNALPSGYISKIAGHFMRSNIQTAYEAMLYFNQPAKKSVTKKAKPTYQEESVKSPVVETSKEDDEGFLAFMKQIGAGEKHGKG